MDLRLQFLEWIASQPRTYAETMDAWRSTCPRLSIWEDALTDGLIRIERAGTMAQASVTLTPQGRTALTEWSSRPLDTVALARDGSRSPL